MNCPGCQAPLGPDHCFCPRCGRPVPRLQAIAVPAAPVPGGGQASGGPDPQGLFEVALAYRQFLLFAWFLYPMLLYSQVFLTFSLRRLAGQQAAMEAGEFGSGLLMILFLSALAAFPYLLLVHRLTRNLDGSSPWAWVLGSLLLPGCLGLPLLFVLGIRVRQWLQARSVQVGFFGPSTETLRELERVALRALAQQLPG